jgi:peptidyl-prolyl cis-trans isomerase D
MRRISLRAGALSALAAAALAGCSNFRDLFTAHADVAAEAAGTELSSVRLAEILARAGGRQRITRTAGDFVAGTWVDYALFGQAVAEGKLPTDSASIAEAVWPEISELKGTHYHDTLMARRTALSDSAADSLYRISDIRVLQHILFGVKPNTPPEQRTATRRKAEGTLTKVKGGASFGVLASQLSEDPGSKADSGFLPPSPRGRFVPAFDSAAWSLNPGQVSGLVETPFGYHIIRRPRLEDVRARIAAYLEDRAGARLDSVFMDSLGEAHRIKVLDGASAAMRAASESPDDYRRSQKALVTYKGGEFTVQEYLRWVRALPPQYAAQLRQANDTMLSQFGRVLTQNVLLIESADDAGVKITPDEWSMLRDRYMAQLDTLKAEMDLNSPELTDSSISQAEREKIAALKVETYFDKLVGGKLRPRPLPSALTGLLRDKLPYRVNDAGVNRAVELALEESDSASAKGAVRPAPGGPPVPGAIPPAGDSGAPRLPGAPAAGDGANR